MSDENILRGAPTGPIVSTRGQVVIPQIAVAASSTGSGSFTFEGAEVGDNVLCQPRASLGNVSGGQAFVASADHITLIFNTGGAALTIPTQTFDVTLFKW